METVTVVVVLVVWLTGMVSQRVLLEVSGAWRPLWVWFWVQRKVWVQQEKFVEDVEDV